MKINVHVERLILEGLPRGIRDAALVQAAFEAELGRRLAQRGIPKDLQTGGIKDRLLAPTFRLGSSPDAKVFGAQVGAGVYNAIAGLDQQGESHG